MPIIGNKVYRFDNKIWNVSLSNSTVSINDTTFPLELLQQIVADSIVICTVDDCVNKIYARGLCMKHYRKFRDLQKLEIVASQKCTVLGCDEIHHGRGYCEKHYWHLVRRPTLVASGKIKDKANMKKERNNNA